MTWFAFKGSGSVYNLTGVAEKELAATGAHGYATEAQAKAHPNAPESGAQAALLAADQVSASLPAGGGLSGVQSGTTQAAASPIGTLAGFLGLSGKISGTNLVIRGAKVIIGGLLLIIGLVHITGADNAVASLARKVPVPI